MSIKSALGDHHPYTSNWTCPACREQHSWNRGCDVRRRKPQAVKPEPVKPEPRRTPNQKIEVVRGTEVSGRCKLCKKGFKKSDAVIEIADVANFADDSLQIHRRCMEALLSDSIDDAPKEKANFDHYRDHIADKYGIETQDG